MSAPFNRSGVPAERRSGTPHPSFGHPLPSEGRGQGEGCPKIRSKSPLRLAFALLLTTSAFAGVGLQSPAFYGSANRPAAAGGGPTLVAEDNFDSYTDASDLDGAANWVKEGGTINVNKPASDGSLFPGDTASSVYRHTASFNANQRCEMTIDAVTTAGNFDWIGPAVRCQTGANTGYGAVFSSGDLYLISITAGVEATINSDTAITLAAGNRIAIEASGSGTSTRLKVQVDTGSGWVDKWTDQNPVSDIDGGACGVIHWLLSVVGNRADDWKGYDL